MAEELPEDEQALELQGDFFADEVAWGVALAHCHEPEQETKHGKYSGGKLHSMVHVRNEVIRLFGFGLSLREVNGLLKSAGVPSSVNGLLAFKKLNKELVATEKKRVSGKLSDISELMLDQMRQRLIDGTMKVSSVDLGIILDKKAQVDGDAGLIIEHRHSFGPSAEDFAKKVEAMRQAKVIEVRSQDSQASETSEKPQ